MSEPAEQHLPDSQGSAPAHDERSDDAQEGQVSEGPSSMSNQETAIGGADAVPDTPDVNPGTPDPVRETRS